MRRPLRILAAAALSAIAACQMDDKITGPDPARGPGALEVQLATPNADDGALLLTLSGGPVDSVTSGTFEVAALETAAGAYRVLIRGPIHGGAVARLWVPERGDRSAYVVSVTEAVGRTSYARQDVAGYVVTVGLTK